MAVVGLTEKPEESRLRYAACLMSDIGWRINPDFRAEQSLSVIAHSAMSGIDHPGRAFLALTVYLRHAGPNEPLERLPSRFRSLIGLIDDDRRAIRRARILAAAIRTAHMMSMGHAGIIDETRFIVDKDKLVFVIPKAHAELNGYRLRRRFEALSRLLGFQPVVGVDR
jgi:exopolyphosphatase/guanosine-5'-triphosphate,3'-diphosphate pyrophosphatase